MAWTVRAYTQLAPNVEVHIVQENIPLDAARNVQAERFLASKCSHLFLLDADCNPQDETIQKLLAWELPFISAPHPTRKGADRIIMALVRNSEGYTPHLPALGLQMVDAVGGSGILMERRVLECYGPPWFRTLYDERGGLDKTEDFWVCERAKEHGFQVWADFSLVQQHIREVPV